MVTTDKALAELRGRGLFSCRDLAGRLGVSRQAALVELKWRVASGELRIEGSGRGTLYGFSDEEGRRLPAADGHELDAFWDGLTTDVPRIAFVRIVRAAGSTPVTRNAARRVLAAAGRARWIVASFRGVTRISSAFARELFVTAPLSGTEVYPLHTSSEVEQVCLRARMLSEITPQSG